MRSDRRSVDASVVDPDGVVFVPAFTGLGSPWFDPYARGAVFGLTRGTTRAHVVRAVVESMAWQTADVVDAHCHPFRTQDLLDRDPASFETRCMFLGTALISSGHANHDLAAFAEELTETTMFGLALRRWAVATAGMPNPWIKSLRSTMFCSSSAAGEIVRVLEMPSSWPRCAKISARSYGALAASGSSAGRIETLKIGTLSASSVRPSLAKISPRIGRTGR